MSQESDNQKLPLFKALAKFAGFENLDDQSQTLTQNKLEQEIQEKDQQPRDTIAGYGAAGSYANFAAVTAEFDQKFRKDGTAALPSQLPPNRLDRIPIFRLMAKDSVVGIALKQHTSSALSYNEEKKHAVEVVPNEEAGYNDKSKEVQIIRNLHERLKLDDRIFDWGLNAGQIGDFFVRVYASKDNKKIDTLLDDESTVPENIFAYEQFGKPKGYICPLHSHPIKGGYPMLNPWEMIHITLPGNRIFPRGRYEMTQELHRNWEKFDLTLQSPPPNIVETHYGDSMLALSFFPWKNMVKSLESVMISRINKSVRDRAIFMGMSGGNPQNAMQWINNMASQLIKKKKRDEKRLVNNELAQTVNNLLLPYDYSNGQGKVDISVIDPDVNIRDLADIMIWVNILCGSLGTDRTTLGWADAVTASLGRDSSTMTTIIQAVHAERLRRAMGTAILHLDMIELTYQTGKYYVEPPHVLDFHSISVAKEQAEIDNLLLKMDAAERIENMFLAAERGNKDLLLKMLNSKFFKFDETIFNAIVDQTPKPPPEE